MANDIDATVTTGWNFNGGDYSGFTPIGSCPEQDFANPELVRCGYRYDANIENYVPKSASLARPFIGPFTGSFDGNGKRIISLHIDHYDRDANGLFGGIRNAEINDLRIYNAFVKTSTDSYNSILAGYAIDSTIRNSSVEGTLDAWYFSGGLVGYANNTEIINSFAIADDTFFGVALFGTLVGYLEGGSITQSNASGSIIGYDASIGGLVGYSFNGRIIGSNSNVTVGIFYHDDSGTYPYLPSGGDINDVGGLVGTQNGGEIVASYSAGDILTIGASPVGKSNGIVFGHRNNIGGLVGRMIDGKLLAGYNLGSLHYQSPKPNKFFIVFDDQSSLNNAGGVVGLMEAGEVRSVYSKGDFFSDETLEERASESLGTLVGHLSGGSFTGGYSLGKIGRSNVILDTSPLIHRSSFLESIEQKLVGVNSGGAFRGNRLDEPIPTIITTTDPGYLLELIILVNRGIVANCRIGLESVLLTNGTTQSCLFNGKQWGETSGDTALTFYDNAYWGNSNFVYNNGNSDVTINYGWLFGEDNQLPVLFAREELLGDYLPAANLQRSLLPTP